MIARRRDSIEPRGRAHLLPQLLGLVEERRGVLAVVHDLTLAAQYCDRLVLISSGEVVAQGTAAEVLRRGVLRAVYGAAVDVFPHPQTGLPVVAPSAAER